MITYNHTVGTTETGNPAGNPTAETTSPSMQDWRHFLLQETHSTPNSEKNWMDDWGNKNIIFSHGTSNSRGVGILFKDSCDVDITKCFHDDDGRFIILDVVLNNQKITIINVYGPNKDEPLFFESIHRKMNDFECESIIWGGDFNCVLDIMMDKKGGRAQSHCNSRKYIYDIISAYDLVDIWRKRNPNVFKYTWHSNSNPPVQCRLDFFLVSFNLLAQVDNCNISTGFKTDHSSVDVNLVTTSHARGRGFWKFNTSLLQDANYVKLVKGWINETVNDVNNRDLNPNVLWDFLKYYLRSETMKYSASISRKNKSREVQLIGKINELEGKYNTNPSDHLLNNIKECKTELESLYKIKADGCIIRSKANWIEHGERNSNYFINLEKRNQKQKTITKLNCDSNVSITDPKEILQEEETFYRNLYSSCNPTDFSFADIFDNDDNIPKLNDDLKHLCEGLVTSKECLDVLKTMSNNKTPGTDGFPAEFYKCFFFDDISNILVKSYNYSFQNGCLSIDQSRGIINLIPKKDKDPTFLKNWRPISLLNTDYKIITKVIALRLKNVLPDIINNDQTGFLKGRYIGENIRLALDTIEYLNDNNLPGLMFLIDFEKAFDKLEWSFLFKTLEFFNFGQDLINWIKVFYSNISSCVTNNGHSSTYFNLSCGVRQGCPLSPLLYILCSEILNCMIRKDDNIKGIKIADVDILLSAYADDTTIYVQDIESLERVIGILNRFHSLSGLKINFDKSELLALGSLRDDLPNIDHIDLKFTTHPVRLLGVYFHANLDNMFDLNFAPKLKKLKEILRIWSTRDLTPIGKITIVKSLALSQLIFLFSVLTNPPDQFIKEVNSVIFNFIWSGKPDKISRNTIIGKYEQGGLKMIHVPSVINGLKIAWVKRLLDDNGGSWKCFYKHHLSQLGGDLIWECNIKPTDKCILSIKNVFIRDVVHAWCSSIYYDPSLMKFKHQILWNNSAIIINKKSVFKQAWYNNGIKYLSDILDDNGKFLTWQLLRERYHLKCNFLEYYSLLYAIPNNWKRCVQGEEDDVDFQTPQDEMLIKIMKTEKVCRMISDNCISKIFKSPISEEKWSAFFNDVDINWHAIYQIPLSSSRSTHLRYFQYRVIHRIIGTNNDLFKFGYVNSNLCTFCNIHVETIQHLFWECTTVARFWDSVRTHILRDDVNITMKNVILGSVDIDTEKYNFLFLHGKKYIYDMRCNQSPVLFQNFVRKLKYISKAEKAIANTNTRLNAWNMRWGSIVI